MFSWGLFVTRRAEGRRGRCKGSVSLRDGVAQMRRSFAGVLAIVILAACQARTGAELPATIASATLTPAASLPAELPAPAADMAALTLVDLANAEYHSPDWGTFRLSNGVFHRTPAGPGEAPDLYATTLMQAAFGDLDADGTNDAVAILQTRNGGTGDSKDLAVVINEDGRAANVATEYLGSMIAIDGLRIEGGTITVDMRVHGPADGLCCPSQFQTKHFRLETGRLVPTG